MRGKYRRHLFAGAVLALLPLSAFAYVSVGISVNIAPPALPVYVQPPCPVVGWIWTPGYWAWADGDYYWVPGTWIAPPAVGLLWTPGYWGWREGVYVWHAGYWGPHVGFYGGVNYGYGYGGVGFEGGYWRGGEFFYNRSVANLGGLHVTNVYNKTVINNVTVVNRVSYNGGAGGLHAVPSAGERAAEHEHHVEFTSAQREHEHLAASNHDLRASVNGGRPRIAATARPNAFTGQGVVGARSAGGPVHGEPHAANHGAEPRGGQPGMRSDRPPGALGGAAGAHSVSDHERTTYPAGAGHPAAHVTPHSTGVGAEPRPQRAEVRPPSYAQPRTESRSEPHAGFESRGASETRRPEETRGSEPRAGEARGAESRGEPRSGESHGSSSHQQHGEPHRGGSRN